MLNLVSRRTKLSMRRSFELLVAVIGLLLCFFPLFILLFPLYCFYGGTPIFKSARIGYAGVPFVIYKFRTMRVDTPLVSTGDLTNTDSFLLPFGRLLRLSSVDEIPQFINIIKGDMNLVGPRPALPTDKNLIKLRRNLGVNLMRPGITGLAQVNGRDSLSIEEKVNFEAMYLNNQSLPVYFSILLKSFKICVTGADISH